MRLEFNAVGLVPEEVYASQAKTNTEAGHPVISGVAPPHDTPLAIVGGGPSVKKNLFELVNWPGHIWAINQGAQWLMQFEPKCPVWMFSVDPDSCLADWTAGVDRAILGSSCHPKVFESMRGKDVRLIHTRPIPGKVEMQSFTDEKPRAELQGPSSVTRVFLPALQLGYKDVTFFGCEGSIEEGTHAYRDESATRVRQMVIRAGDREYITTPDYYMTTRFLANALHEYPKLKEKSGGLLRAMLANWDTWAVVALSEALRDQVIPEWTTPHEPRVA